MNKDISSNHQIISSDVKENISGIFLAWTYLASIALYYLDKSETLKYFQYLLPLIGIFISMRHIFNIWYSSGHLAKLCSVLFMLSFINLCVILIRGELYIKFLQETFLFIGALLFAIILIGNYAYFIPKLINNSLYVLIGIFIIDKNAALLSILSGPEDLILGIITSTITTESSLSFYFALLGLYFIIERRKAKSFIAIVFMILSFKRIAFVGFIASLIMYWVVNIFKVKYNRRAFALFVTIFNFIYLWCLIFLVNGTFDEWISDLFGVSSNFLFMGRVDMYTNIFSKVGYSNLFGIGIGRISDYLSNYTDSGIGEGILTNLHSDILKYYLELGVIGFLIFIYNFIYYLSKNAIALTFLVMLNIIFLTDNVSIYFGFMVLFFLINYKVSCSTKVNYISQYEPRKT